MVIDTLNAIFAASYDIINIGKNITLKFGFCNIYLIDRNLSYSFSSDIYNTTSNLLESETKVK